jgi:hypothetical protein
MPFQPAPSILQTTLEGRMDNQLTINDLFWFSSGAITPSTVNSLLTGLSNWLDTTLSPLLSRDMTYTRIRAVDLGSPIGLAQEMATPFVGGVDVEAAPNNVAACVSLRTAQRGRSGRGRNFLPGIPNSVITLNTLDATFINNLVGAYIALPGAGVFVAGWQLVVLSRVTGGVPRAAGIGIPVTDVTMVGNSVRSMRSREIGHGA